MICAWWFSQSLEQHDTTFSVFKIWLWGFNFNQRLEQHVDFCLCLVPLSPWGLSTGMSAAQLSLLLAPRPPTIPAVTFKNLFAGQYLRLQVSQAHRDGNPDFRWTRGVAMTAPLTHEVPHHAIQCSDCDWQASARNPTLCNHLVHVCRGTIQGFCPSMMRICNIVTLLSMHNRQKLNCYDDATDTADMLLEEHLTLATYFVKNAVQGLDQDVHARNCLGQNLLWQWPEAIRHRRHTSPCALLQGPEVDLLQRRLQELIATANCEKTVTVAQLKKATKCRASPKVNLEALRKRSIFFRKLREKGPLK